MSSSPVTGELRDQDGNDMYRMGKPQQFKVGGWPLVSTTSELTGAEDIPAIHNDHVYITSARNVGGRIAVSYCTFKL